MVNLVNINNSCDGRSLGGCESGSLFVCWSILNCFTYNVLLKPVLPKLLLCTQSCTDSREVKKKKASNFRRQNLAVKFPMVHVLSAWKHRLKPIRLFHFTFISVIHCNDTVSLKNFLKFIFTKNCKILWLSEYWKLIMQWNFARILK